MVVGPIGCSGKPLRLPAERPWKGDDANGPSRLEEGLFVAFQGVRDDCPEGFPDRLLGVCFVLRRAPVFLF